MLIRNDGIKILLVNPPIRMADEPECYPYGLATIASVLRGKGFKPEILDLNIYRPKMSEVGGFFSKSKYDVIGVGGLVTTYRYLKDFITLVRSLQPEALLVVGGGVVTENPEHILKNTSADIAVIGEGEMTMTELVERLEQGMEIHGVDGICFLRNGELVFTNRRSNIKNLSDLPLPAYDLLHIDKYLRYRSLLWPVGCKSTMHIYAGRGCYANCNFCYHIFGRGLRFRSVDHILEEMDYLVSQYPQIDSWLFGDECFLASGRLVSEFCSLYPDKPYGGFPWACYGRVDLIKEELLYKLKKAGCKSIGFGIESGSQKILDRMNKKVTVERARDAIRLTRKYCIHPMATLIFGYPGEDDATLRDTIAFCKETGLCPTPFFATAYPGTILYKENINTVMAKYGTEEKFLLALDDATSFTVNLTDWTDSEFMEKYQHCIDVFRGKGKWQRIRRLVRQSYVYYKVVDVPKTNIVKSSLYFFKTSRRRAKQKRARQHN